MVSAIVVGTALTVSAIAVSHSSDPRSAAKTPRAVQGTNDTVGRLQRDPVLSSAKWIWGDRAAARTSAMPSLVFPKGTTYGGGLQQLYTAVVETGSLPAGASLGASLRAGVVVDEGSGALRISLAAPWGYAVGTQRPLPPSFSLPGTLSPEEAQRIAAHAADANVALPTGATVDVPTLARCEKTVNGVLPKGC